MNASDRITEQEIGNLRNTLTLLRRQIETNTVEQSFALRQMDRIADMLQRVSVIQQGQSAASRFKALYDVSRMLGTSLDQHTVLNQVMDAVIKLTGAERGFIMLRDDDGQLQVEVARNIDQQTIDSEKFQYSRTISHHALDKGEAVLTTNAVEDPRFANQNSIVSQSLRSIMAVPLWARGRIIGVAYVENRVVAGLFSEEDLTFLETFMGQASIVIDNAILFSETDEELSRRVEEMRDLRRIDLRLSEQLDPDEAMATTLEWACRLAGDARGYLGLLQGDPPQMVTVQQYGTDDQSESAPPLDTLYPETKNVLASGQSTICRQTQQPDVPVLIVPVLREKDVIGVVVLESQNGEAFDENRRDLVERVVTRAAITIENTRLYAAVQAADRAKSEFVGIVAHDLKAPMTSIRGYADLMLMQSDNLSEKQTLFLKRISNTVERMEILVSDLADISRIESGQFLMEEMRLPVQVVVEAVRDTIAPEMQSRNHQFIEHIAPDLPEMYVDYYRLLQVLTNLLSNAYKYTPDGGKIGLKVWAQDGRIHFAVRDTGIGLTSEGIAKLQSGAKFWRAEDDYTRRQPGTGLGFAITSSLVQQMGSHITISSTRGKGSEFTFSVAVAQNETDKVQHS